MSRGLVAHSRFHGSTIDPIDVVGDDGMFWHHSSMSIGAFGTALEIPLRLEDPGRASSRVSEALDAIEVRDEVALRGSGPLALGALPFDASATGTLIVPKLIVVRGADGRCWVTTITAPGEPEDDLDRRLSSSTMGTDPSVFTVTPEIDVARWRDAVVAARGAIERGSADKVVLARAVGITTDAPIPRRAVLERLRSGFSSCMVYGLGDLVGASPELLVSRDGDIVRSHPMAGTAGRSDDPVIDAELRSRLATSTKDLIEHRYTIDMGHEILLPWCSWLDEEAEPSMVELTNVRHLATLVEGRLSSPTPSVVELMAALHPTPAVCGSPRDRALALIGQLEAMERGSYSGPVGWVDHRGDGEWAVAIRCAELKGNVARLMAGVGVVADSDPDSELAETRSKLQALLGVIIRP